MAARVFARGESEVGAGQLVGRVGRRALHTPPRGRNGSTRVVAALLVASGRDGVARLLAG